MLADPDFEPIVVVCPVERGILAAAAEETATDLRNYFSREGIPFVDLSVGDRRAGLAEIEKIDPHVVFYTNPHGIAPRYLHEEFFLSRLTCYVPYSHEVMAYGDNQEQYNQASHNAFWKVFVPHEASRDFYRKFRIRSDSGVVVTGFPACEPLLEGIPGRSFGSWKPQDRIKKRVVYAPHWLLRPDIKMATVYDFGEAITRLAEKYQDEIQWSFRPHPMLEPTMHRRPGWNARKVGEFFEFWEGSSFSQRSEGDYIDLFRESDAIIHDSGSFLAEYLYLGKPALYLATQETGLQYFNSFGLSALDACEIGKSVEDIDGFLRRLVQGEEMAGDGRKFLGENILPYFDPLPSQKICDEIRKSFL